MDRRLFISRVLASFALLAVAPRLAFAKKLASKNAARALASTEVVNRFAFGSCARQWLPQPIWKSIRAANPQFFVFLGDNVYNDTTDPVRIQENYEKLAAIPEFANFRAQAPVYGTWDDHDYGVNDCGAEFPEKEVSRKHMLDFFGEPKDSPRRKRAGVYTSYYFGSAPRRLQLILLDLRWNRTPLYTRKKADGGEEYAPHPDPAATMIGQEQWAWLEKELEQPADLRVIGSSLQFIANEHRWEKWANYPADKKRLLKKIDERGIKNLVFMTGDMHYGEICKELTPKGNAIHDITSSGMNYFEPPEVPGSSFRLGLFETGINFGLVSVDWNKREVSLEVRNGEGTTAITHTVSFA